MDGKYALLHSHTEFSVRDSLLRADELPKIAADYGWGAVAITDHGGVEGVPKFLKAAKKLGIKGIAGIELYVGCPDTYTWGVYKKGEKIRHLTALAKNGKGFSSILRLLSIAHRDCYDARRQKAAVPIRLVLEELEECVIMSGCAGGAFWRGTEAAPDDLAAFVDRFKDDFFLEVMPLHDMEAQINLNRTICEISRSMGVEMVVTTDCHFAAPEDQRFHEALLAVADRKSIHDPSLRRFSTKMSFVGRPRTVVEDLGRSGIPPEAAQRALEATGHVSDRITAWCWNDLPSPEIPTAQGDMELISRQGLEDKGLNGRPEYVERLNKELATFKEANIDRYLLLVKHCVDLFRREGAEMGPRGSVGGSLVAYCMGITPIDPIRHGLSYERFYAPGRKNWPDIDLDVDEAFRERVPLVLRKEFGDDRVAQISNYIKFGLRLAIHDAARAYGVQLEDTSRFEDDKDFLKGKEKGEYDIADIPPGKELARKSPDAAEFARRLVGKVRQYGAHAGGFVIAVDSLLGGRSAVVSRGKDKALCWDMEVAEELGFIKIDFLGLDTLSVVKEIRKDLNLDLASIPLDDAAVFKDFSDGLTAGVPQFLSPGMRSFIRLLKPTKFEDLVWANAAFRPGGLGQMDPAGLAEKYHEDPGAIIVYQEEVMQLSVDLAGFSWTEADQIRKIIAKSKGPKELEKYTPKFVEGCARTSGWSAEDATALWDTLSSFGRYAFNKCLHPSEKVLMYNDQKKTIGELEPGDILRGPDGSERRVRKVWRVRARSWRISLDDGSRITCSPDHRFLGEAGVERVSDIARRRGCIACSSWASSQSGRVDLQGMHGEVSYTPASSGTYKELPKVCRMAAPCSPGDHEKGLGGSHKTGEVCSWREDSEAAMESREIRGLEKDDGGVACLSQGCSYVEYPEGEGKTLDVRTCSSIKVGGRSGQVFPRRFSSSVCKDRRRSLRDRYLCDLEVSCGGGWASPFQAYFWGGEIPEDYGERRKTRRIGPESSGCLPYEVWSRLFYLIGEHPPSLYGLDPGAGPHSGARSLAFRKVVGVEDLGEDELVDIEVDGDHLFLLESGIVSHNSHATAYSANGYYIAWAKRHYPIEAFTAMLNAEENFEPILSEVPKFGIKVLPPDPNRSTLRWEKESDGIRMPLTMVDGIDLRLAKAVFDLREKAPLVDARDFAKRMKKRVVPTGLPEALFSGRMPGFTFNFPVLVDRVFVKKSMTDLIDEIKNCGGCDFREYCKHPVPPELGRTNVMIVGEAPGWEEDKGGRPFIGKSGRKLDQALARFGLSGKEFTYSNGAKCAPPFTPKGEDGVMTVAEIEKLSKECPWLEKEMAIIRPPLILALGRRAWQKLGGQGTITKANGCVKNLRDIKVVACLHPAYVLRNSNLESDMDQAIEKFAGLYRALVPSDGKPVVRRVPEPLSFRDRARRLLSEPNQARGGP